MSHVRRYHEPGVGARTGMRVGEGAHDLGDFMAAARRAMNAGRQSKGAVEPDEGIQGGGAAGGSSTMVLEESPGPSPRSTLRRSHAPSSSPFLSSPGTGRNQPSSPLLAHAGTILSHTSARISSEGDVLSISSPSRERGPRRGAINAGLEARRERRRRDEEDQRRAVEHFGAEDVCDDLTKGGNNTFEEDGHSAGEYSAASQHISPAGSRTAQHHVEEESDTEASTSSHSEISMQTPSEGLSTSTVHAAAETRSRLSAQPPPPRKACKTSVKEEGKPKPKRRPLSEKNGSAAQWQDNVGAADEASHQFAPARKRKASGMDWQVETKPRAVIERIPSSHHRQPSVEAGEGNEDGLRRGSRYRYKPLEYWRGEKARFGRLSLPKVTERETVGDETIDGDAFEDHFAGAIPPVAVLKEIIRVPREEGEGTFSGMRIRRDKAADRPRASTAKAKRSEISPSEISDVVDPTQPTLHAEAGWDKDTDMRAAVYDAATQDEVEMQIACTSTQVRPRLAVKSTFGFEKVFVVDHAMATGVLFILIDGEKPLKNSKENNYTFVVLEGAVRVHLHKSDFVIAPHGMFFVPRGNDYSIENIAKRTAKIAFTQCRGT